MFSLQCNTRIFVMPFVSHHHSLNKQAEYIFCGAPLIHLCSQHHHNVVKSLLPVRVPASLVFRLRFSSAWEELVPILFGA